MREASAAAVDAPAVRPVRSPALRSGPARPCSAPRRAGESRIRRQQRGAQPLRQRHVGRAARRQVVSRLPRTVDEAISGWRMIGTAAASGALSGFAGGQLVLERPVEQHCCDLQHHVLRRLQGGGPDHARMAPPGGSTIAAATEVSRPSFEIPAGAVPQGVPLNRRGRDHRKVAVPTDQLPHPSVTTTRPGPAMRPLPMSPLRVSTVSRAEETVPVAKGDQHRLAMGGKPLPISFAASP
jgi:hypothetical protein